MALSAVGLKTHIWNNNLKALLFLLFYPIVITATYISAAALVIFFLLMEGNRHHRSTVAFTDIFNKVVMDYWYVPYALITVFLLLVYLYNLNRVDIAADMQPVTRETNTRLYDFLETLCISRGLTVPLFFVQQSEACNAYTSGLSPQTYRIVVTSGLVEKLNEDELECVLAHELTHLINGDTRLMFLTGTVTNMFRTLAQVVTPQGRTYFHYGSRRADNTLFIFLLSLVLQLANIGALFAQCFISRKREYIADAGAVELTKNPEAMMSALKKVAGEDVGFYNRPDLKPTLFHYQNAGEWTSHPPIAARIAAISNFSRIEAASPWTRKAIREARNSQAEVVW